MTLTYDMTFLVILLNSLYEPDVETREARCAARPHKKHLEISCAAADYAADMNVALAYHKLMDDWHDEHKLLSRSEAALIEKTYLRMAERYPRQIQAIERGLEALGHLEKRQANDIDECVNLFGTLMGEVFVWKEDQWADTLREMGAALGRFVYLMDAYDDLESDRRKGRFNPLIALSGQQNFDDRCRALLTMLMADCTRAFETLPLVEDIEILRNILYSGVWTRFEQMRKTKTKKQRGGKAK